MNSISAGFDWASLFSPSSTVCDMYFVEDSKALYLESEEDSVTLVDVGGGDGACCMALAKELSEYVRGRVGTEKGKKSWRFVVQDRPDVVKAAKEVWEKEGFGNLIESGDVSLVGA